ncbi:MAG: SCO family protein [Deltaproteobacteria bacterium]|nr:MAG: SCO family protein [Deltaproteobacteria bacterium]
MILVLLVAVLVAGCSGRPSEAPPAPAVAAPDLGDRLAVIHERHLPNIELVTHEGRSVRFYDDLVKGKVVAINFMFATCRAACPASTQHLVEVQKSLGERTGRDVTFLSISLDPEHDTPEVLRGYAEAHGAGPGWYFLTGKRDDIELLRHKLGAYDLDPVVDADRKQHTGLVILGNEPVGRWKAISALSKPVRIRQAIERTILPATEWSSGEAVVNEAPYEENEAGKQLVGPADLSDLPARN